MTDSIRNVYCVGRNYGLHAAELGNAVPEKPMLFMKPTHAVVPMDGREIGLPGSVGEVHFEAELVIRIGRPYAPGMTVDELIDGLAFGIDFTLRDVQSGLKKKGYPWLEAKGFRNSAPIGGFMPFPGMSELAARDFVLRKNGQEAQRGNVRDMIFNLQRIVEFTADNYGLDKGDVIFTGTPAGVGPVTDGDRFELFWGDEPAGSAKIVLSR